MPTERPLRAQPLEPRPDRLPDDAGSRAAALEAHTEAIHAGQGGYLDPSSGLFVMTASELIRRGYCCDNGCRHCPYEESDF